MTPECNLRSETSVTVPSRLNAPSSLVGGQFDPASLRQFEIVGWSPLRGCSQLALPPWCIVHFVGDLGPSKWEFWQCE